ncbi:MAG: hypothetical protein CFE30_20830 [Bradyrhizobium sp. PARBB1]|nr:MAG: hypothetical protein CFE30_20830 [Bradyrhizobium sp. PARBB1]PSO24062.1 hypothetical protein C7G43_21460 [Bradyrhizobium sp. MOS004]HAQ83137.1 hypothetical protein [Bradyrhizobium sp.]HAR16109.1 hypothetical protein [Bradyrhizobium sp.]HAR25271.1 hypothetical protein [Bradyrhizobium sp.]
MALSMQFDLRSLDQYFSLTKLVLRNGHAAPIKMGFGRLSAEIVSEAYDDIEKLTWHVCLG